ncbi:flavin-containing monooxygenase [Hymenobacter negativus]|uniref:FAD-dependent oxidoreductase n=1 Tax=Hymenobacter negativus TaxID=2795026 RepID=A0ABS3QH01_9BACT|nr:NAD(P)/FAD-dependent oxidoreductase [Hymenobacter negativus]MBO2010000.1 FAD-dependent oxidoreductase [Hymenobacter negativus]
MSTPDATATHLLTALDTVVIGAGQAGLAAAYYLQQHGVAFRLLEAAATPGAAWETRYDSLRLFSPAWASGLPGYSWPGPALRYPTRDETTAYLQKYAAHFRFPIDTGQRVVRLTTASSQAGYEVQTEAGGHYLSQRVIIATGPYTTPRIPSWAVQVPAQVIQLHSSAYRRPAQLPGGGPVAVVGSGNSALQIGGDIAATGRPVMVAFDEKTPAVPNNQLSWALLAATGLMRIPRHTGLGRWMHAQPEPVVRGDLAHLRRFANATFIGRATASRSDGSLQGQQAASPPLDAIVWATGYQPDYSWIDLPIIGSDGHPRHQRGLTAAPGIAFLGLDWLDSRNSALLNGVGADARRVVHTLLKQPRSVHGS